uniref:Lipoprotein cytochrome c n=1 Tax=Geobacter sulfurreducens (strain ATCC 51573 / DSM 12127 / PCA) TaxID=243231 RepID=UPI0037870B45
MKFKLNLITLALLANTGLAVAADGVDPGKTVYDSRCASCHRLGTYDASGSAPNLSRAGTKIDGKFTAGVSGHKGITLTAADLANLKTFVNANGSGWSHPQFEK